MSFQLGEFELDVVSGGRMRLDGGTMFGAVPRVLWQRKFVPDERNRIELDTNCVLVRSAQNTVLIDTGYGSKVTAKESEMFGLDGGNPLVANLASVGVKPEEIDTVILTHLHFDHAGGCTERGADGKLQPVFPRARYVIQTHEWEDATGQVPELEGAYFEADLLPLQDAGKLELVLDASVLQDISVRTTGGHTRGHQIVTIESEGRRAVCLGDVCPTATHVKAFWTMGYDLFVLELRRLKPVLLGEIADNGWLAIFGHDPKIKGGYFVRDEKQEFIVKPAEI